MNSDALAFLAAKGLSLDDVVQLARIMEKKADPTNAERQARYREKRAAAKGNALHNGVTPPNDNKNSNPPEVLPSEAKASLPRRGKSHRLPDDWEPEPLTGETADMVAAWPVGMIERELSKFKNYWKSASGRKSAKLDWQAAWRFWLTNADEWSLKNGRQPANQQISRGGSGKRDSRDGFERACDRLIERAEAGRQPDGGIGGGGQRALAAPRAL